MGQLLGRGFELKRLGEKTGSGDEFANQRRLGGLIDDPRALPRPIASAASAASWQVKALVEATPISGPASVGAAASVSRAMLEPGTLTTPTVFAPLSFT